MMKHSLSMINYLSMNYLPIFSRWLWKYVVYIINISLLAQIIGSHFWWYLCSIFSFQPTKYSLSATDRIRNPPTLLRIIRKSLFFFQQCTIAHKMHRLNFCHLQNGKNSSSNCIFSVGYFENVAKKWAICGWIWYSFSN